MTRRIGVFLILGAFCILFIGCRISGTITENGVGIEGVTVTLGGNVPLTTTTDSAGNYEFNNLLIVNRAYIVTPVSDSCRFNPETIDVKVGFLDVTDVDFVVVTEALEAYRKSIPITAGIGAGAEYQVRIRVGESAGAPGCDVQLEGHGRPDFADVRFTDNDGETLLDYWLESVAGISPDQTATFWVCVHDSLDADQRIFIYYGDNKARSASDGAGTFDFYDDFEEPFDSEEAALENAPSWQVTPTYEGSGQAIHPDIVYFPDGWNGYEYWMAMTPYPGSDDYYENPSILVSHDGEVWEEPTGIENPLIGAPPCDHNNDTDLIYNTDTDELWVYYLDTRRAHRCENVCNDNYLILFKSSDGINWNGPFPLIHWDLDDEPLYLSPSVIQLDVDEFYLWVSNGSDTVLLYESTDGENWQLPQEVNLDDMVWHLNVSYIPEYDEYWMLSVYPSGSGSMHWAVSTDRINWTTYPARPVLVPSESGWDTNPYRGCFLYDADTDLLRIWYSAYTRNPGVEWHTGYVETDYTEFLARLLQTSIGVWTLYNEGGSWTTSCEKVKRGNLSGRLQQTSTAGGTSHIVYRTEPVAGDFYLEWDMYDDLDEDAFKLVRINSATLGSQTGLGVYTGKSDEFYVYHDRNYGYTTTGIERTPGWNKFGIKLASDTTASYYINDISVGSNASQFAESTTVSVEGYYSQPTVFHVDDIRIRKAASVEPAIGVAGSEEEGSWLLY